MKRQKRTRKVKKGKPRKKGSIAKELVFDQASLSLSLKKSNVYKKESFFWAKESLVPFKDERFGLKAQIEKKGSTFLEKREEKEREKSNLQPFHLPEIKKIVQQKSDYKILTGFSVPDFLNGQKQSFKNFLTYGLIQELNLYGWFSMRLEDLSSTWAFYNAEKEFIKMPLDNSIDVIFHGQHYKLTKPSLSPRKAILARKTYSSQLYVPIQINLHWTKEVFIHWFLLANLPMMTKKGHFIINGNPRVILNQIIRRPGIYFKTVEKKRTSTYVADFIAQRGTWLRLEIVRSRKNPSTGKIWAKLKRLKKVSVTLLLSDLGLSQSFFDQYLNSTGSLSRFKKDAIFQNTFFDKIKQVENFLGPQVKPWVSRLNSRQGYFRKKFSNAYFYSLSQSGRQNLNQTLGLNLPINHITLTGEDVLLGCCQLIDFFNGSQKSSDIDDLKNRKLRPTGELIQNQISLGLVQLRESVLATLNKHGDHEATLWKNRAVEQHDSFLQRKAYFETLVSNAPVNAALKSFFATNPLSQFLDQTNPLSELTHKRRISSLGEGGIQRDTATMAVRGIHPSHYGRICPIETPEGQNAGLVNSFTAYAKLNALGLIETPFYNVYKGMVVKEKATMFSSDQEKTFIIAPGDVAMTKENCLISKKHPVRQADRFNRFLPNQIDLMAIGPLQMISIATSLIPFLEHDDGNRALMGSNMQRQAVPTLIASAPIVGTGFESRVLADSCVGIQAKSCGFVSYVDNQKVVLYNPSKTQLLKKKVPLTSLMKPKGQLKLKLKSRRFNLQHPFYIHGLTKQVSKMHLFGHLFGQKNKTNRIDLNQMQLQHHLDSIDHHAYFSLWFIFSTIAKQTLVKGSSFNKMKGYFPLITQTALALLQQTYTAAYFNHYCILLLHQIFDASNHSDKNQGRLRLSLSLLKSRELESDWSFMSPKVKWDQDPRLLLKGKINPCYEILKYPQFNFKTNRIITPYRKGNTKQCLKALLKDQEKRISISNGFDFKPSFQSSKSLKIKWSSSVFPRSLGKVVNQDLEADTFTKPLFSDIFKENENPRDQNLLPRDPKALFHMPLFESKPTLTVNSNPLLTLETSDFNFNVKNQFKPNQLNPFKPNIKPSFKAFVANDYNLTPYFRSNQDTPLAQKPLVSEGQWVEKGDALADTRSSLKGELAIGQNLLVGYTPWEGYNFEDAVLLNQRVISEDLLTTLHIERYEINFKDTRYGSEFIPEEGEIAKTQTKTKTSRQDDWDYLCSGIIKVGTWVEENMVLVRKCTPTGESIASAHEKLVHKITKLSDSGKPFRDTSVRVPANVHGRIIHVEIDDALKEKDALKQKKSVSHVQTKKPKLIPKRRCFRNQRLIYKKQKNFEFVLKVKEKANPCLNELYTQEQISDHRHLLVEKENTFLVNKPFTTSKRLNVFSKIKKQKRLILTDSLRSKNRRAIEENSRVRKIEVYIAEQRKVQVGDKIAGRHGNKGIISAILPREDMPYLPDGSVLDIVLNPLGVPSRMNVGQIFECLLGLAGSYLNQVYKIQPFDETYGIEASRSLVYSKLYEARLKTNQSWLFNPNYPGKVRLFDGRTGQCFAQPVTVGKAYILKLIHLVDEKIHARSTGPYSVITQQPLRGRSSQGGQRVGEMEVWAFEGFGAAYILQELLTIKSDDMENRKNINDNIITNKPFAYGTPESFNVLMNELKCLCLNGVLQQPRTFPLIYSGLTLIRRSPLRGPRKRWPFN